MSTNDEVINQLQTVIFQLKNNSNQQIDVQELHKIEAELENILPQIQFELTNARMESNWEQAQQLSEASQECQNALNSVRSAIIRSTIIGINQDNLTEMQKILDEVKAASKTQQRINIIISSLRFVKRILG
ncbi:hypothetical protein [Nostoc sp. TCL26-01]|uniref:hypothetical protein n=1 Tax=Nostoc sp. TCL26-01 TaxID=2576904 RepID=UPI0015BFCCFB|nr:hypothetical protein [Nostoc sp. TCL26-01]QLE54735.1 hypothetical protein FD725_03955 [Nostoc sp. TCL26-01]